MAYVVAKRATNTPPGRPKIWFYWDGKGWTRDAGRAERHESRAAAVVAHAALAGAGDYPPGGSPVVVERA